jgi:hypothetical protein
VAGDSQLHRIAWPKQQSYPLPSRYFTPAFVFWACVLAASLSLALDGRLGARLACAAAGAIVFVLTVGTADWQMKVPEASVTLFEKVPILRALQAPDFETDLPEVATN